MQFRKNPTYPDKTHYVIAVQTDEEEDKLEKFLKENNAKEVE